MAIGPAPSCWPTNWKVHDPGIRRREHRDDGRPVRRGRARSPLAPHDGRGAHARRVGADDPPAARGARRRAGRGAGDGDRLGRSGRDGAAERGVPSASASRRSWSTRPRHCRSAWTSTSRSPSARTASSTPSRRAGSTSATRIVVDLGTATTFDCITADGVFLGGVIAPGVRTSAETLFRANVEAAGDGARRAEQCDRDRGPKSASGPASCSGAADAVDGIVRRINARVAAASRAARGGDRRAGGDDPARSARRFESWRRT